MRYPVPPKYKEYKDEWGTGAREGYEDRGTFRPPREPKRDGGSPFVRSFGALCIIGGLFWGTWLVTRGGDMATVLNQNHGPLVVVAIGLVASILGKFIRL